MSESLPTWTQIKWGMRLWNSLAKEIKDGLKGAYPKQTESAVGITRFMLSKFPLAAPNGRPVTSTQTSSKEFIMTDNHKLNKPTFTNDLTAMTKPTHPNAPLSNKELGAMMIAVGEQMIMYDMTCPQCQLGQVDLIIEERLMREGIDSERAKFMIAGFLNAEWPA